MVTNLKQITIALINNKAPFSYCSGKESLDLALIFSSFEQRVSLFFQGDGVYQLIKDQDSTYISVKNYLKTFSAFEFYDIEDIYICQQSLLERQLSADFHIDNVQVLSPNDFSQALRSHQHILRF